MGQHYKDLIAWQRAMELVIEVYEATRTFPRSELYSLTNQMQRAAVSIPSNIAEGQAHFSRREFLHYLQHARGSLAELETQIIIAGRLNYLTSQNSQGLLQHSSDLGKIMNGLIASVRGQIGQAHT